MVELLSFLMGSTVSVMAYQTYRILFRILPYLTPPLLSLNLKNNWVLVAGSTDGIGK
jgi:hypothetical protein